MLFDELNELFISVYSAIEHELNSNEIKSLISDNNTILKSLDVGSYVLKVESNGSNSGLPKSLNVTPHKYKKSDFSCSQGYSIPIEITIKEEKKEENVFSRKGGNVCMALIGKRGIVQIFGQGQMYGKRIA